MSGVLPEGAGSGKRSFATRSTWRTSSSPDSRRSARRTMFCAATAFVAFAPIFAACSCSAPAFFSAFWRSRLRRCSSPSRCFRYWRQPML